MRAARGTALGLVLLARLTLAQGSEPFSWSGDAAPGSVLRVRNIRGDVSIVPGAGRTVEVKAMKAWRRGNPGQVRVEARKVDDGIIVCVLWGAARDCESPISGAGSRAVGDVSVDIEITAPPGLRLAVNTTIGNVAIRTESRVLAAESVNGNVVVNSSQGTTLAQTVNGTVIAYVAEPAKASIDVEASGRLHSDFEIRISQAMRAGKLQGTIGGGGKRIELRARRGDVWIRRGTAPPRGPDGAASRNQDAINRSISAAASSLVQ